jgi:hypothetical protein
MALIVEDGTVVTAANSYDTLANAQAFLTLIGLTDTAIDEPSMVRAYYYVNSFENQYQGQRISADQTGSFPRSGVVINGFTLASDEIPSQLIQAQAYAAYYEVINPGVTQPNGNGATITHEEISGAVAVDYADNGISSDTFNMASVTTLLSQLFGTSGGAFSIQTVRI